MPLKTLKLSAAVSRAHLMATAHLPTTAKVGLRTQGFTADRGHAESAKQIAPSPPDRETAAGMRTSSTRTTPRMKAGVSTHGRAGALEP
jgi:hypothetical protein